MSLRAKLGTERAPSEFAEVLTDRIASRDSLHTRAEKTHI